MRKIITVAAAAAATLLAAPAANADVPGTNPDGSPTGGALYQLVNPIKLGTPDVSVGVGGQQFAQLRGMNINVGQLLTP